MPEIYRSITLLASVTPMNSMKNKALLKSYQEERDSSQLEHIQQCKVGNSHLPLPYRRNVDIRMSVPAPLALQLPLHMVLISILKSPLFSTHPECVTLKEESFRPINKKIRNS